MERLSVYIMSKIFTLEEMEKMETVVASFWKTNHITPTPPVDIFRLATTLGFDVRAARFQGGVEGLIMVDESSEKISSFHSNKVIAYNFGFDLMKSKFVVAHELAHYIDEKMLPDNHGAKIVVAVRDPDGPNYSNNEDEQRKDYMAAALLIPKDDLLKRLPQSENLMNEQLYQELADYYRVDIRLAKRRVKEVFQWLTNGKADCGN